MTYPMKKTSGVLFPNTSLIGLISIVVLCGGCQTAFKQLPSDTADVLTEQEIKAVLSQNSLKKRYPNKNVAVYCTGLYDCNIASIDHHMVVSRRSGKAYRSALEKGLVYLQKDANGAIKYLGLLDAGEHLVNMRFYPVSANSFDNVSMQHAFHANSVYRLHGYRRARNVTSEVEAGSLLSLAIPNPLCVVLYENQQPIRQFCKKADITTGLGQFIEEPVNSAPAPADTYNKIVQRFVTN